MRKTMMLHRSSLKERDERARKMLHGSSFRTSESPPLTRMLAPSAYRARTPPAARPPLSPEDILFYSNLDRDLDICPPCHNRMSAGIKAVLPPMEAICSWEERARMNPRIDSVRCDICQTSFQKKQAQTKATVAIALRPAMADLQDIALACESFPWSGNEHELATALRSGGFGPIDADRLARLLVGGRRWLACDCREHPVCIAATSDGTLDTTAITEAVALHLLKAEEQLRLLPETQQRYAASRTELPDEFSTEHKETLASTYPLPQPQETWVLEDDLQMEIMRAHGVAGKITAADLAAYRAALAQHYYSPLVQADAPFFIRLNILQPGAPVGSVVPAADIPLHSMDGQRITLAHHLQRARAQQKQLVVFAGSITWPPFRVSDASYTAFITRNRSSLYVLVVYLWEAHFVERDPLTGDIRDGWPIGYFEYEHPQHKSLSDRLAMAAYAQSAMSCMQAADAIAVDDFETNAFNEYFGAWPDQAFYIDTSTATLEFRGQFSQTMAGTRDALFSDQLEAFLASTPPQQQASSV